MTDALRLTKRAFTIAVAAATIVWSVGVSAFVAPLIAEAAVKPLSEVTAGSLIKGATHNAVYVYDGVQRHAFPNQKTYSTWYGNDFSKVVTISMADLGSIPLGSNVVYRPGSRLVKIDTAAKTYAVLPGGDLAAIPDEATAKKLWGANWAKMVDDVPDVFFGNYSVNPAHDIEAGSEMHPDGALVSFEGETYLVEDGALRLVSAEAFAGNHYASSHVHPITEEQFDLYDLGDDVGETEFASSAQLMSSDSGSGSSGSTGGSTGGTVVTGGPVSVEKDGSVTIPETILADSSAAADGAQMLIPAVSVKLTAGSSDVKVKTLKFTRIGVAADTDISNTYLYDGWTRLAEHTSFKQKVVTFTNSEGLFTVPAGSTKTVTLRFDLANSTGSSKTIGFQVASASDVELVGGGSVNGTFPFDGGKATTSQVSDLGTLQVSNFTTYPATIDPGSANRELWRFTLTAGSQDVDVQYMKLTMVGTVDPAHLQNLNLMVGGVQIGEKVSSVPSSKELVFNLSSAPYKIKSGEAKVFTLNGDVTGGAGRVFKFTIQRSADFRAWDRQYTGHIELRQSATTGFTLITPTAGNGTSVNSGSLTLGVSTDSPVGSVADAANGVTLGKFDFKAVGEDVKITSLEVQCTANAASNVLVNVKILANGVQIGTTDSSVTCDGLDAATSTLGNTFIVRQGTTSVLSVVADTTSDTLTNGETVTVRLATPSSANGQGLSTLNSITTPQQAARTLTVSSGTFSVTENQAFTDRSATAPTGVANAKAVKIASFVITAGAGEASDVSQIVLKDSGAAMPLGEDFTNLKLMHDSTQLGNTIGTLNSSESTYSFAPTPAIRIPKGETYIVDVYADVKSSPTNSASVNSPVAIFDSVTATGVDTGADTSYTTDVNLQDAYLAANGNLRAVVDSNSAVATQLVMGTTEQELAKFKFSADSSENISISKLVVSNRLTTSQFATGTIKNLKLYDASGNRVGSVAQPISFAASTTSYAVFDSLSVNVPKNQSVVLTLKGDVTTHDDGGISGSTHLFFFSVNGYDSLGPVAGTLPVTAVGAQSGTTISGTSLDFATTGDTDTDAAASGNTMTVYRTKLTIEYASDSPSGAQTGAAEQVIAKLLVGNTSNSGSYDATLALLNFTLGQTGISNSAARAVSVYKDSQVTANQVATTNWGSGTGRLALNYGGSAPSVATSGFEATGGTFTDTTVSAGTKRLFIVVADTSDAGADDRLSFSIAAGQITWGDGITTAITTVNDLPLAAKTLTY